MYVSAGNVLLYPRSVNRLRSEFCLSAMVSTLYYYVYKEILNVRMRAKYDDKAFQAYMSIYRCDGNIANGTAKT